MIRNEILLNSNNFKYSRITLYRECENRVRYYTLKILPTLFSEFILVREYGAVRNSKPTRIIEKYFNIYEEAYKELLDLFKERYKRGYMPSKDNNEKIQ